MSKTIVVGDVHLGSRHCRIGRFLRFLDQLPPHVALVLNGDIIDHWHPLPPRHEQALERLRAESLAGRTVVWLRGNNDQAYRMPEPGAIRFESVLTLEDKEGRPWCQVLHGHQFDRLMHGNALWVWPIRALHKVRMLLGAPSIHVAQYAKRWRPIYGWANSLIVRSGVRHARQHGVQAVIAGHTHQAEERTVDGIRYVNAGSWTEDAVHFVEVEEGRILLRAVSDDGSADCD